MSFFKEVVALHNRVNYSREQAEADSPEYSELSASLAMIESLMKFIKHGDWATDKARERVMFAIVHGYSAAAEQFQCSVESIKSSLHQGSDKIKKLLGYPETDILDLIRQRRLDEATYLFQLRTNRVSIPLLFPTEIHGLLPLEGSEFSKLNSKEFLRCVNLLKDLTIRSLNLRLVEADDSTMSSIFFILLGSDMKLLPYKIALYSYLQGDITEGELIKKMKIKEDKYNGTE